jgi:branched-chain amino acid transport system ATP-binding protein
VTLLGVHDLRVSFGAIRAVDGVSLRVDAGEIVGLVGPNGAGKTTLFDAISGQLRADSGTIELDGAPIDGLAPFRRARLGLGRTFQRVEIFGELSVSDNLLIAARARRRRASLWRDLVETGVPSAAESAEVADALETVGLADRAAVPASTLSLGACRLLEVGRALVADPVLLLADEPTSGLDAEESARLATVLAGARRDRGLAVLVVEHNLVTVRALADRVVALDLGRVIAEGDFSTVMADPAVRRAYLGQVA